MYSRVVLLSDLNFFETHLSQNPILIRFLGQKKKFCQKKFGPEVVLADHFFGDFFFLQVPEYFGHSQNLQLCPVFQWMSSFTSAGLHETGKRLPESVCLCSSQGTCCMPVWTRILTEMHIFAFPDKKKNKFQEIIDFVPTCQLASSSFSSCRPTRTSVITLSSCSRGPICNPPAPGHHQSVQQGAGNLPCPTGLRRQKGEVSPEASHCLVLGQQQENQGSLAW